MNAEIVTMFKRNNITIEQLSIVPTTQALSEFIEGNIDAYNIYSSNELYELKSRDISLLHLLPR